MFSPNYRYSHDTAKDLDIYIVKVRYVDDKRSKLLIRWISKTSNNMVTFPGGRADGLCNITIKADDYKYWKKIGS